MRGETKGYVLAGFTSLDIRSLCPIEVTRFLSRPLRASVCVTQALPVELMAWLTGPSVPAQNLPLAFFARRLNGWLTRGGSGAGPSVLESSAGLGLAASGWCVQEGEIVDELNGFGLEMHGS